MRWVEQGALVRLSTRGTAWRYANIVATQSQASEAPRLSSQRWVWKRPLLGTVLRSEQGSRKCRNFFRSSDGILRCLPASGRSGHCEIFFFFFNKTGPSQSDWELTAWAVFQHGFTGKSRQECFLDSQGACLHWLYFYCQLSSGKREIIFKGQQVSWRIPVLLFLGVRASLCLCLCALCACVRVYACVCVCVFSSCKLLCLDLIDET